MLILIAAIIAFLIAKNAVEAAIEKNRALEGDMVTELSQLKKEEPKKEEKKKEPELKYEEPKEKVKVKASIEFTVPKIVDDDKIDHSKELKTQDEVTKSSFAIASQDYAGDGDGGINIDDLKDNQSAGGTSVPKEEEVVDNALVEVQATYPGGEAALLAFIGKNLIYPQIALEQELQGKVILRFQVKADGSVGDIVIQKSLSRECDQAAKDVVKKLKRFIPAKQQGRPVPVWFTLPISFQIQ
ncbi:MAG: TonB family protein [Alloprevotella sp.]|nr:TonB family protein [Bacteroidales bacterium]MDY4662966.1 TonB family protein [Alloprevotella sp.]